MELSTRGLLKKDRMNETYENDSNVTSQKWSDLCSIPK